MPEKDNNFFTVFPERDPDIPGCHQKRKKMQAFLFHF
jgi:hypothetical protein